MIGHEDDVVHFHEIVVRTTLDIVNDLDPHTGMQIDAEPHFLNVAP
jgi:hypothetical protein